MSVTPYVSRREDAIDSRQLDRVVGVSPGRGEVVYRENWADRHETFFLKYPNLRGLGPTKADPAIPVEARDEDNRVRVFGPAGFVCLAVAGLALLGWNYLPAEGLPFPLIFVLAVLAAGAALAYHYVWQAQELRSQPPNLPVYGNLAARQNEPSVALVEKVEVELSPVMDSGGFRLKETLKRSGGLLRLNVRQTNPQADAERYASYVRRFGSPAPEKICLGHVVFDRSPNVVWLTRDNEPDVRTAVTAASPRILSLSAPVAAAEYPRMFSVGDQKGQNWQFAIPFELKTPQTMCPSISVAIMLDPTSLGHTLRLSVVRAVGDRSPEQKVRITNVRGVIAIPAMGAYSRLFARIERSAGGQGERLLIEDNPSTHPPAFDFEIKDDNDLAPGDSLILFFTFDRPIRNAEGDHVSFEIQSACDLPFAGFRQIAFFNPLGWPGVDSKQRGAGRSERAVFAPSIHRRSSYVTSGVVPLKGIHHVAEETLREERTHTGRLPDSSLLTDLIANLASEHRLAIRDVREDLAERSAAERGSLVWTILAKDSENMLSPDIIMRVSGVRRAATGAPAEGSDGVHIEISVIATFLTLEERTRSQALLQAIVRAADDITKHFVARRPDDEVAARQPDREPSIARDRNERVISGGTDAARLASVLGRVERLVERFERIFDHRSGSAGGPQ